MSRSVWQLNVHRHDLKKKPGLCTSTKGTFIHFAPSQTISDCPGH